MSPLFAWVLGAPEIIVLVILGVILFGRKLPEVGRSLGKTIVEFKKGVHGLEDDLGGTTAPQPAAQEQQVRPPQRVAATAPKFEDNPANPPKA